MLYESNEYFKQKNKTVYLRKYILNLRFKMKSNYQNKNS